jgi:hypothetical protein
MVYRLLALQLNQILTEHVISNLQEYHKSQQLPHLQSDYSAVMMHRYQFQKAPSKLQTEQSHLNVQTILGNYQHIKQTVLVNLLQHLDLHKIMQSRNLLKAINF